MKITLIVLVLYLLIKLSVQLYEKRVRIAIEEAQKVQHFGPKPIDDTKI